MPATDPKAYGESWFAATRTASPERSPLGVELDVDVCVIGGGLAGLTTAREVARRGWSVVVLEAQRIAWNASGRNTGFVLPGFAADADALIARVGLDHARKLWALSEAGADYVRRAIEETDMPGAGLSEGGWLHVSKTDDERAVERYNDVLVQLGAEIEAWPAERVRAELQSPAYFGATYHPRGFAIHPLNYALGLAASAEAAGARIFEQTAAIEIDPAGVRKRIVAGGARVRAAHVVLAGNVHLRGLMPAIASTLLPIFTYVIATAPLGEALHDVIRFAGAVSDTDLADNHYRVVEGDRLLWSGRSTVWRDKPQRYVETLVADIARVYPQLGQVKAEYAWTGTLGNTVHRMPQIGEFSPGLWLLSGFGGHGLNTTAMGGEIIARAIVEGDTTWRLFSPFELVWAGGRFGRAAQQAYYWSFRTRERADAWLARQRQAKRRQTAGAAVTVLEIPVTPDIAQEMQPVALVEAAPPAPDEPLIEPPAEIAIAPEPAPPSHDVPVAPPEVVFAPSEPPAEMSPAEMSPVETPPAKKPRKKRRQNRRKMTEAVAAGENPAPQPDNAPGEAVMPSDAPDTAS